MRLGLVVNPDAGLGGKLGFKGSDGRAEEARAAGAQDRAGPRMNQCLTHLLNLTASSLNRTNVQLQLVVWGGRMGGTWVPELDESSPVSIEVVGATPDSTTPQDTAQLVADLLESGVEAILYAVETVPLETSSMRWRLQVPKPKRRRSSVFQEA